MDWSHLIETAIAAAESAGRVIQKYMHDDVEVEKKEGGSTYASQVVTAVDIESEKVILSYLLPTCKQYDLGLLTEETEDDGSRFEKDFFWCIDPMDGTLSFINDHPGFAISIALIAKDGTPYLGVVFDPSTDTLYHAVRGKGVFKNGDPWIITNRNDHLTFVSDRKLVDTSRSSEIERLLNEQTRKLGLNGIKEISGAGAVLNGILVLENGPACMLKFPKKERGGGCIWDYAATACFFQEFGLPVTNFQGERLDLNKKDGAFMNPEGIYYSNLLKSQ